MGLKEDPVVQTYISSVCAHIRNYKVHEDIKTELLSHIEEIVLEYVREGVDETCAIEKAIIQMGDAELVGKELNKIHKLAPEWSILILATVFESVGVISMYFIENKGALLYELTIFNRSFFYTILGMAAAIGLYYVDYSKMKAYSKHIYVSSLLILFYVVHWGTAIHSARRWLSFGSINVNFVAISPFLFIVALAGLFDDWDWQSSTPR